MTHQCGTFGNLSFADYNDQRQMEVNVSGTYHVFAQVRIIKFDIDKKIQHIPQGSAEYKTITDITMTDITWSLVIHVV